MFVLWFSSSKYKKNGHTGDIPSPPLFLANIAARSNISLYGKYFKTKQDITLILPPHKFRSKYLLLVKSRFVNFDFTIFQNSPTTDDFYCNALNTG